LDPGAPRALLIFLATTREWWAGFGKGNALGAVFTSGKWAKFLELGDGAFGFKGAIWKHCSDLFFVGE